MSLPPVARRSLAIAATTALLTSGATGLFTGTAFAANNGVITSVSPTQTNNSGNSAFTITGSNFQTGDRALLAPTFSSSAYPNGIPGLNGTSDSSSDSTHIVGTIPTSNAAPGTYDVYTQRTDITGTSLSAKCPACFKIFSSGLPSVSNVASGASTGNTSRGAGALDLSGQFLAQASVVEFDLPNGAKDPGMAFVTGDPNDNSQFPGYASSTLMRGNYSHAGAFTPGKHFLRVTNTAGESGASFEFWQPSFTAGGVSPNTAGAGAQNKVITVTGQGIRQGSTLSIQSFRSDSASGGNPLVSNPDVSVGPATVSADGTTISAPVSFTEDAQTGTARSVTVTGPDRGSYSVPGAFTVTPPPSISSLSEPALGQGAVYDETISGSNFANGSTPATRPVFTVSGTGVTTQTLSATNIQATVRFIVASDAPVEDRTIQVLNPDGGTGTASTDSSNNPIFTVDAGPTITSVSPGSTAAGTSKTVTIKGQNYDSGSPPGTPKATVQISLPPAAGQPRVADPSISVGSVTVTKANGVTTTQDSLSFSVSVASNAPAGPRDVVVMNPSDQGTVLCAGCFGVDNITVSPTTAANSGTKQLALTGAGIVAGSTAKLVRAGDPTIQPAIPGSSGTVSGTTLTSVFDLTDAAPGPYNALVTTPSGTVLSCSSCLTVTGSTPAITSISPAAGGQGANNLPITVTGTNFSRGEQLTITDVLVHDVVWVNRTTLTAKVDIASNAPTGAKDAKVTNADGVASGTKTGAFTVNPPPDPTASSPASYGQGAKGVKITVTGPGFVDGAKADFGPGVSVTSVTITQGTAIPLVDPNPDDTLVATVNIAESAAANQRDVTITNPDGGTGTLAKGFAVNFGPKVTGITPGFLAPNATDKPVTITGSNFSTTSGKTAVPSASGITFKNVTVASDGNSITATATVNSGTPKGPKDLVVTNPTDSGAGTCTGCLPVATPPGAPTAVAVLSTTATSITVKWTPPADNGGAPITSYVVSAKDATGHAVGTAGTTGGNAVQGTVSGLKAGSRYQVLVVARNAAGDSTPGATTATAGASSGKTPTISVASHLINIGKGGTFVSTTGTPGHAVWIFAYSRPSTTYVAVRKSAFDSSGFASFTVSPRTNTRLFAKDMTANLTSASTVISVHPALSLFGSAKGKVGSFSGGYVPGLRGASIRIFTVKNGRLSASPVGTATTDANGHWTYSRTFAAHGPVTFIVQSLANLTNASGQGNRVTVTFS